MPDPIGDWAKQQLGKIDSDVHKALNEFAKLFLWIRLDGELIQDSEEMYTKVLARMELPGRQIGDTFSVDIGGTAIAPLAQAILGAQAKGKAAIRDALRQQLFAFPPLRPFAGSKIFTPNPGEEPLIIAMILVTIITIAIGTPIVVGGSTVFLGIAAAIVIATAMGNELDVSASNPGTITTKSVAGLPVPDVKVGPVVTLHIRKAH